MIVIERLCVASGEFQLREVSCEVPSGCYGVLMGRTGSGKTTLLEAVAGLKKIASGRLILDGVDVTTLKPAARNLGYVPQDGALFPTKTVRGNLSFALSVRGVGKQARLRREEELAEMLEIRHLLDRRTVGLSGGEKQRVAIGRALAFGPGTLLLDEPLSAVDHDTRGQIIQLLKRVQSQTGVTCLHVTHNHDEAQALADVRLELVEGAIKQSSGSRKSLSPSEREEVNLASRGLP